MAMRKDKRKTERARSRRPADATRARTLLLEQLRARLDGILAAVKASHAHLEARLAEFERHLSERIDVAYRAGKEDGPFGSRTAAQETRKAAEAAPIVCGRRSLQMS
jgi:hypothetical protein